MANRETKICFAASSGGHLKQVRTMIDGLAEYPAFLVTEEVGKEIQSPIPLYYLPQINRRDKLLIPRLLKNAWMALKILLKEKPTVIISTGALSTVCILLLGKLLGAKVIFVESFSTTHTGTHTGRFVYPFADRFMVQWESLLEAYPKAVYRGKLY